MFLAQLQEPCQWTYSSHHRSYTWRYTLKSQPPCTRAEDLRGCCAPLQAHSAEGQSSSPPFRDTISSTRPHAAIPSYLSKGVTGGQPFLSPPDLSREVCSWRAGWWLCLDTSTKGNVPCSKKPVNEFLHSFLTLFTEKNTTIPMTK